MNNRLLLVSALVLSTALVACKPGANTTNTNTNAPAASQQQGAIDANSVEQPATADAAASNGLLDPLLASPQVGDLYAAKLNAFSSYDFGNEGKDVYGMMRVVEVHDDRIVVITESSAWPEARLARNELRGSHENVQWDESEKITIPRNRLAMLQEKGDLLEARRM